MIAPAQWRLTLPNWHMAVFRPSYMQVKPGDIARDRWRDFDPILFITMLVLMGFGILAIWSAVGLPPLTTTRDGSLRKAPEVVVIKRRPRAA